MNNQIAAPKIIRARQAHGSFLNSMIVFACLCATTLVGFSSFLI